MAPRTAMSFEEFKAQYLRPSASLVAVRPEMSFEDSKARSSRTSASSMVSRPAFYYDSAHKAHQPATVLPSSDNSEIISLPAPSPSISANTPPPLPFNTSSTAIMQPSNKDSTDSSNSKKQKQKKNKPIALKYWLESSPEAMAPPVHATFDSAQGRGWGNAPAYPTASQDSPVQRSQQSSRNHGNRRQPRSSPSGPSATRNNGGRNLAHMMQNVNLGQQVEVIQRYD